MKKEEVKKLHTNDIHGMVDLSEEEVIRLNGGDSYTTGYIIGTVGKALIGGCFPSSRPIFLMGMLYCK